VQLRRKLGQAQHLDVRAEGQGQRPPVVSDQPATRTQASRRAIRPAPERLSRKVPSARSRPARLACTPLRGRSGSRSGAGTKTGRAAAGCEGVPSGLQIRRLAGSIKRCLTFGVSARAPTPLGGGPMPDDAGAYRRGRRAG
jgi:hypothetical protein